jgi:hypothetical protein
MIDGTKTEGQLLFDDFSTHNPQVPSGVHYKLLTEEDELVFELQIDNDPADPMAKLPFLKAASQQFHEEIKKFVEGQYRG